MAAYYTFEDHSGSSSNGIKPDNPYHDLIESCDNDPTQIQTRYATHRTNRNSQQKEKLLSPDFKGVKPDEILAKLENSKAYPEFVDPRHCLVFWARPTQTVKNLIREVQAKLKDVAPNLWLMPQESLHMTALEITHSRTEEEIEELVQRIGPHAEEITDFTLVHRARLVKPMLSFDAQALALSFLPAAEGEEDAYTYHHLRRDLFSLVTEKTGVKVASRYVTPSAHLTVGRFIETGDFEGKDRKVDAEKVQALVQRIEEINAWLEKDKGGVEWIVGQEKGLEFRNGTLWYGSGGETVRLGRGF